MEELVTTSCSHTNRGQANSNGQKYGCGGTRVVITIRTGRTESIDGSRSSRVSGNEYGDTCDRTLPPICQSKEIKRLVLAPAAAPVVAQSGLCKHTRQIQMAVRREQGSGIVVPDM
jgi:hypothetical protein